MFNFNTAHLPLARATAFTTLALTLAASPSAHAASYQFALHDLATFTSYASPDTTLSFAGTGFVGMTDDRWDTGNKVFTHVLGLETDDLSRTLMQVDLASLAGQQVLSAKLSFQVLHGDESGTNSIMVHGFDSAGVLGMQWDFLQSSHSAVVGQASALQQAQIDITPLLQYSVDNHQQWLGMHLQAVGTKYLFTSTHDYPELLSPDLARVRIDVITSAVPEPGSWVLMLAGVGAVAGLGRRRLKAGR